MLRSEAMKRRCCADNHKCQNLPMFSGANIDTGQENEVACTGHVWLLGGDDFGLILDDEER